MTMKRPTVGLVLSGGGARGFAHVGVIKVLEELGIPIDIVVGTSMGAMVGGGYASGMTTTQMQDIILGVDWEEMFALRPDRNELNWRQRNDDYKNLFIGEIGITPEGPKMPSSLVPAQHLGVFLSRITEHVADVNDLSNLA
ncbi:MAG: patatin-like phospholipase family protein, partial [Burkholderiaceae bacterium]|nr:patatin-like phospholipase family protein [Burkholderiaceae bacterium]